MTQTVLDTTGSLASLLLARTDERPDHPFLWVEEDGPWTLTDLATSAASVAADLEVGPGDRVLLRLGNDERFLPALAGVWLRGASAVAMHPAAPAAEVDRVVRTMGVAATVADVAVHRGAALLDISELQPRIDGGDEALVLLTSGSTGNPKGVALSHGAVWASLRATVSASN